ncbi:MAG: enoyl-CoA hydratase-related protein, partial [Beutenbergiaceae bacterium]
MAERVTHCHIRDIDLSPFGADGLLLGLITLDNGEGPRRPNTLGPQGMANLHQAITELLHRADQGELHAIAITGKPMGFAAGADLHGAAAITSDTDALAIAQAGHNAYRLLLDAPVPTFAFVGGAALGGGLELAASCRYRTVMNTVRNLGLPEAALGLIPGWGGTFLIPGIIGIEAAVEVILTNPLRNNRQLDAAAATGIGLMDAMLDEDDFLGHSLRWAVEVLQGRIHPQRPDPLPAPQWRAVLDQARRSVDARLHGAAPAPYEALELLELSARRDREASFAAEDAALVRLLRSAEFKASLYAFDLTTRRAKHPVGAPDVGKARPVAAVGIAGAGLMATQLALLLARRMDVPVIMRDLDLERAQRGLALVASHVRQLLDRGQVDADEADRITARI